MDLFLWDLVEEGGRLWKMADGEVGGVYESSVPWDGSGERESSSPDSPGQVVDGTEDSHPPSHFQNPNRPGGV